MAEEKKKTEEEKEEEEEIKSIPLKVKKSKIKRRGIARLHTEVMEELLAAETEEAEEAAEAEEAEEAEDEEAEEEEEEVRQLIVVATEENAILVHEVDDEKIAKDEIHLRPPDFEKLGVAEDDEVHVYLHRTMSEGMKEGWSTVTEKWKGWFERFRKEEEEEEAEAEEEEKEKSEETEA